MRAAGATEPEIWKTGRSPASVFATALRVWFSTTRTGSSRPVAVFSHAALAASFHSLPVVSDTRRNKAMAIWEPKPAASRRA